MSESSPRYDAIIANKLGREGARVLLMDAGNELYFDLETGLDRRQPLLDRFYEATARVPNSPYPNLKYAPMEFEDNLGTYYYGSAYSQNNPGAPQPSPAMPTGGAYGQFRSTYARIFGGTMYHWLGTCLRYLPSTFREKTLYGTGADWPISYQTLEPWYCLAEKEIGVSGDSRHDLGAPRSEPYPMPAILPSYTDRVMSERLQGLTFEGMPVLVESTPQARNSIPYQDRPPCAGSTNCVPICPIQAKYDATVHLKRALNPRLDPEYAKYSGRSRPVEYRKDAVVTKVGIDSSGRVSKVYWKHGPTGEDQPPIEAKLYVLATHGIEIPKILLNSASQQAGLAEGAANSSGLVGRYLMDHCVRIAYGYADVPLYPFRGPLSTAGIESLRDGEFRRYRSAFRIEIEAIGANWALNAPFSSVGNFLNKGVIGKRLWQSVGWDVNRQVQLDALLEPVPNYDSRVTLAKDSSGNYVVDAIGVPRPRLDFVIDNHTVAGAQAFAQVADMIIQRMGGDRATVVDQWFGAGHVMGTFRMGDDPKQSVTDSYGKSWDHDNLYLTGSGMFPTVCSANPTLTIVAVTLRQVEHLKQRLQEA
jgi:choline dehydrogenase-like flavoprotein